MKSSKKETEDKKSSKKERRSGGGESSPQRDAQALKILYKEGGDSHLVATESLVCSWSLSGKESLISFQLTQLCPTAFHLSSHLQPPVQARVGSVPFCRLLTIGSGGVCAQLRR
jgi:hypothetical protein